MVNNHFQFFDPSQAQREFERLYDRVVGDVERVHIARDGDRGCVLISAEELESLEHAIEILSDAQDVRELARSLARVAHVTAEARPDLLALEGVIDRDLPPEQVRRPTGDAPTR